VIDWLKRNAAAIEAVAATLTALVAVLALVGIKLQLDAADRLQRAQSARDAFRAHLVLSVERPAYAYPADACALLISAEGPAYGAFVEHLLYSAEQMLSVDPDWGRVFAGQLEPHAAYLCSFDDLSDYEPALVAVLTRVQAEHCPTTPACGT
jgi:hypothetical protein